MYITYQTTMTKKGQIVLAKEVREALEMKPGQKIMGIVEGRVITLVPIPKRPLLALRGMLKGVKMSAQQIKDQIIREGEE